MTTPCLRRAQTEGRRLFIGGMSYETTDQSLEAYLNMRWSIVIYTLHPNTLTVYTPTPLHYPQVAHGGVQGQERYGWKVNTTAV